MQARRQCFCRSRSTFVPTLYRKSKKRSDSLDSLDSGIFPTTCSRDFLAYAGTMETKRCSVLVDEHECGLELFQTGRVEAEPPRQPVDLYECPLGHRSYFLSGKESKPEAGGNG